MFRLTKKIFMFLFISLFIDNNTKIQLKETIKLKIT